MTLSPRRLPARWEVESVIQYLKKKLEINLYRVFHWSYQESSEEAVNNISRNFSLYTIVWKIEKIYFLTVILLLTHVVTFLLIYFRNPALNDVQIPGWPLNFHFEIPTFLPIFSVYFANFSRFSNVQIRRRILFLELLLFFGRVFWATLKNLYFRTPYSSLIVLEMKK